MFDVAIKNGLCFIDGDFIQANVGINGNRIAYVGRGEVKGDAEIDASSCFVLPGLFNAHTHLAMTLFRGFAEDMPLMDWLRKKIWRAERKLTPKDVYWGSMLGILEMLKTGTTGFSDLYIHMDEVARAVGESGIRAVLCYGMADRGDAERAQEELRIGEEFIREWNGAFGGRVTTVFGPHAPYTCTPEFLKLVKEKADEIGCSVHIHVSETQWEVEEIKRQYGKTPVRLLNDVDFLDSSVVIAHGVWLDDEEIAILADRKVSVVHCPVSNLKLASGIARVSDMVEAGVNVALGTDGAASNNTYNLFEEIKLTSLLQKVRTGRADVIKAGEVLRMATHNGYAAYGLNGGEIKEGALADVVVLDGRRHNFTPMYSAVNAIVYGSLGCEVRHVVVDGKLVVQDGEVLTMDEEKVIDKAERIVEKFRE